jgi:hypothetical protein
LKIESARNVDIFAGLTLHEAAMDEDHPASDRKRRPSKWAVSTSFLLSHQLDAIIRIWQCTRSL